MRVECPVSIERGTFVTIRSSSLGLNGSASVRSSARRGSRYVVGLNFTGGMTWKGKA